MLFGGWVLRIFMIAAFFFPRDLLGAVRWSLLLLAAIEITSPDVLFALFLVLNCLSAAAERSILPVLVVRTAATNLFLQGILLVANLDSFG